MFDLRNIFELIDRYINIQTMTKPTTEGAYTKYHKSRFVRAGSVTTLSTNFTITSRKIANAIKRPDPNLLNPAAYKAAKPIMLDTKQSAAN